MAAWLASLPTAEQTRILAELAPTPADLAALERDWQFWARPDQLAPAGAWSTWLILAGRGWGKSRTGAEWIQEQASTGTCRRLALVGRTAADVRDVMIEGESGILSIAPKWERPEWQASKRRLVWPNGAIATTFSADEPDQLRGPQHDGGWADELAAWRYPEAWDQLMFGMRLGRRPRVVVTTTPRPTKIIRELMASSSTLITRGRTNDNASNLAPTFLEKIVSKYKGTRLGRQELDGEVLEDNPGAIWQRARIDGLRVSPRECPSFRRIVVAIDPAVSVSEDSAETGIIVVGLDEDGHAYVLEDVSGKLSPNDWARRAVAMFDSRRANTVVAEVNNGGDMIKNTLRAAHPRIPVQEVHASRGKATRAEPVSLLYEQGRVHHVGVFPELEDQMCSWEPGQKSPDRLDALVWGVTALLGDGAPSCSFTTGKEEEDFDDDDD